MPDWIGAGGTASEFEALDVQEKGYIHRDELQFGGLGIEGLEELEQLEHSTTNGRASSTALNGSDPMHSPCTAGEVEAALGRYGGEIAVQHAQMLELKLSVQHVEDQVASVRMRVRCPGFYSL